MAAVAERLPGLAAQMVMIAQGKKRRGGDSRCAMVAVEHKAEEGGGAPEQTGCDQKRADGQVH